MPHPKRRPRTMEYSLIYHVPTNSYFINKSQTPRLVARHQFARAFKPERPDYNCDFYQDIRKYGVDAFIIRYCVELPEWCECRAHYVKNDAPNEEIYQKVLAMRTEPLTVEEVIEVKKERKAQKELLKKEQKNKEGVK